MHATLPLLKQTGFPAITRRATEVLQVNVGYRCNQTCLHCHVNAGPTRTEMMSREIVEQVLRYLHATGIPALDITGGAPELHTDFRFLVEQARSLGARVMDRCNLTITEQPGQEDLVDFLAHQQVEVVASLPCYLEDNVNKQRGSGVFQASIRALRKFNAAGYAQPGTGLNINLVYNPQGASLPPDQVKLEEDYRRHLGEEYGVRFNRVYTLANMPIKRFGSTLVSQGQFESYIRLLKDNYQEANLGGVMCRSLLSVDWQGYIYDCDFNQMLSLPLQVPGKRRVMLRDLLRVDLDGNPIQVADHCFGCTAGQGSSCGGALA